MHRTYMKVVYLLILFLTPGFCYGYNLANPEIWWSLSGNDRYERLRNEFASYANYYVSTRGYRFGSGAQGMFDHQFADNAAREIMKKKPADFEKARDRIRSNTKILIDRMIVEAKNDPDYSRRNPGVIGEMTLSRALHFLCPLWPFCD